MEAIDLILLYGIAVLLFAVFTLQFDLIFPRWGETIGFLGIGICTLSLGGKFWRETGS
ncbi:hypothetical protein [Natrinema sp. CBA1119]|uniref:hypothetical protein n=1 Tax=Natrinema sp. CBA1119 TaxID=1608465 RepID=UPI00159BE3F2|nr:hypothetical protein [Natrinema sp. CBA1119]